MHSSQISVIILTKIKKPSKYINCCADRNTTDTELKLRDAASQMKLALKHTEDDDMLRSCINAYISHARSVTFIMQKESSGHKQLEDWYLYQMSGIKKLPLMRFFNDKRTFSIHRGVVKPTKHVTECRDLVVDGIPRPGTGIVTFWQFEGVTEFIPNDSGGVFRFCEQYFKILKWLVGSWLKKRKELGMT